MCSRNILRAVSLTFYKFRTITTVSHGVRQAVLSARSSCLTATSSSKILTSRLYCQEATIGKLPEVDFDYVKNATQQNEVMIIDVREPDEIKEHGKIPNSVNIPLGSIDTSLIMSEKKFKETFNRTKPKENTELIFYCMIGKRSAKAQNSAASLGFKNTKNYLGSWTDWATKN